MISTSFQILLDYSSVGSDCKIASFHTFSYYTHIFEFVCVSGSVNCEINNVKQQTERLPNSTKTGHARKEGNQTYNLSGQEYRKEKIVKLFLIR